MAINVLDWLPEQVHYRDDGCEIAPKCLECPLPVCRYDLPPKHARTLMREAQLRRLFDQGLSIDQAARSLGISRRTVYRIVRYATDTITVTPLAAR